MDGHKPRNFLLLVYLTISLCLLECTWADNISRGKPAIQFGTWGRYGPERAVDGNTDQDIDHGSCAHPDGLDGNLDQSLRGRATWWTVDLSAGDASKLFVIKNVTIYFRSCCQERIQGAKILVGNTSDVNLHEECASVTSRAYLQTLQCTPSTAARYLTIKHPTNAHLGLCEVIANGYQYQACSHGMWGRDCLLNCYCTGNNCDDITQECAASACSPGFFGKTCNGQCNCLDSLEICDPADGYCSSGCKPGYMNINCSTPCTGFYFGVGCAFDCNCLDINEKCNPVTGSCPRSGCDDRHWGSNCSISLPEINAQPKRVSESESSVTVEFPASTPHAQEYHVEYAVDNGQFIQYLSGVTVQDTNKDKYTVTQGQLTPGTRYRIKVVPYLFGRRGGESDPLYITTRSPQHPSISMPPRLLSVTQTSITVEFPASDPVAETYRVMYRAIGATYFTTGAEVTHRQGQTTYVVTIDGLTPDSQYTIKITPVTQKVEGVSSPFLYAATKTPLLPSSTNGPRWFSSTEISITFAATTSKPEGIPKLVIGAVVAAVTVFLITIIIVAALCIWVRRRRRGTGTGAASPRQELGLPDVTAHAGGRSANIGDSNGYDDVEAQGPVPDQGYYEELRPQIHVKTPIDDWLKEKGMSESVVKKLKRHKIFTIQDLQDMSREDMVEAGLKVGERNQIIRVLRETQF